MLIQEPTYSIYPNQGDYVILATENVDVNVYDYDDTTFSDALITLTIVANVETSLTFCEDGFFVITVTNGVFTNEHDFPFFPYLQSQVITEINEFVCNCNTCMEDVMDDCLDCKESNDYISNLAFLSYLTNHMFLFTDQTNNNILADYLNITLMQYKTKLWGRAKNMFGYGFIRGTYPIALKDLKLFYSALYLYYYLTETNEDTSSTYVDTKYDIVNFKKCLSVIGLTYSNFLSFFNATNITYGKYYVMDISGLADPCTDIPDILLNPNLTQSALETGINIVIAAVPKHIMLITRQSWGQLTGIFDNGGMNLLIDTTRTSCGSYYIYTFNDAFAPNTYFFRIEI
jgi:hypothetical protein